MGVGGKGERGGGGKNSSRPTIIIIGETKNRDLVSSP